MVTETTDQQAAAQTLAPSQWIRFVVLSLILPSILLLCGGDLRWWQGWAYAVVMFVITVGGRVWADRRNPWACVGRSADSRSHG
jgi:hypothetical protein